ncbi:complement component C8 gamma chain [Hyperolius riggenbachi]|uniref:complement component C8 gamma chain n=1 Tax=Hyperolius riggenbachi TaxID=752182 RepID=UPI0035A33D7F
MFPPVCLLLVFLASPPAMAQKNNPIDKVENVKNFDISEFTGKWYLLSVATDCNYLKTNNHKVEATYLQVSLPKTKAGVKVPQSMLVSTFRVLDGICWEIKHSYAINKIKGRFLLKAKPYHGMVDIVVAETDYENYAIIYFQKKGKITLKLYGRKAKVSDDIYRKFDNHVIKQGIDLEFIYSFPKYGFCEEASKFNILDEIPR